MKKQLLFLLLIFTNLSFSQDYIPFLNNTSWNMQIYSWGGTTYQWIENQGTVTINSNTYTKYSGVPMEAGDVLVREDVAQRKVYRYKDNQEQLLYDFNLEEDDVITLLDGNEYTVISKDSVQVLTGRKRVRLRLMRYAGTTPLNSETWIESVGSVDNPLKPRFEMVSDPHVMTYCSYNGITPVYNFGLAGNGTPSECPEATMNTIENQLKNTIVYPNPFSTTATISLKKAIDNGVLKLYNIQGQVVKEVKNISGNEIIISRENLSAGTYFVEIVNNESVYNTKIVIVD